MSRTTTAARSLTTASTLFAGPGSASNSTPAVDDGASFRYVLDGTVQTLSTENAPASGPIKGLLFVPHLDANDSCINITAPYIPANVTRLEDISDFGYEPIGLAPWVSADCTRSFLDASQRVGTEALVFFLPSTNDTKPPPADDPVWLLADGDEWKSLNHYPVYAIPGAAGATLMAQLALYSGNETQSKGSQTEPVASSQNSQWDIRLFTLIDLEKPGKKLPSLWGFILAILGTILVLSIILLLCYQLIQKRRRDNLQRRIESGEADFEQLGLHQIKVPREVIDGLPMYIYPDLSDLAQDQDPPCSAEARRSEEHAGVLCESTREEKESDVKEEIQAVQSSSSAGDAAIEHIPKTGKTGTITAEIRADSAPPSPHTPQPPAPLPAASDSHLAYPKHENRLSHTQTTCAICLDDFVPNSSTVRELPCGHIFHPECIDTSLTQNSSLCPLCKKSVLPAGFYPVPVTNLMVQRDSLLRRSRLD